jgi:hypothetical protein
VQLHLRVVEADNVLEALRDAITGNPWKTARDLLT